MRKLILGMGLAAMSGLAAGPARAEESGIALAALAERLDFAWVLIAAALVMLMQIGFLLLEAGMVRSKNSINVAQKNLLDFAVSVLAFALVGFMLAFGASTVMPVGLDIGFLALRDLDAWTLAFFVFQVMFCGTAATIVGGAVAERMRLTAYVLGTVVVAGVIYPVFVHWAWGGALVPNDGAFLANMGFVDFAGSTVVHSTGAWVALAACMVLGPRIGRFAPDGTPVRIAGHSPVLATTGGLLLFVGWIGFNGGSTLSVTPDIAHIIANTVLAGSAGAVIGYLVGWRQDGVILPEKAVSGMLGGLVGVTAGCMVLDGAGALVIGAAGGLVAVIGNRWLERRARIDDAVGAIGVHGFAGVVGTVLPALLAPAHNLPLGRVEQLRVQALGAGLNFVWSFGLGLLLFLAIARLIRLRVPAGSEERGLNESEHATRLGIGHVEDALAALVSGTADLSTRLNVEQGDEAERLTRTFNALLDNLQKEEVLKTEARDLERSAEESERLSTLADATFEAVVISVDNVIVDGNAALAELIGLPIEAIKGRHLNDFIAEEDWARIRRAATDGDAAPAEVTCLDAEGRRIPAEVRGRDIIYRGARTRVSAVLDLRERKKAEERIRFLAQHDPLTDLPNRALFTRQLAEMIARTVRTGTQSAVLLVDLDRFKDINDLYGHPAGDEVIRITAARLRAAVRHGDMVARLGGDEFAVLQQEAEFAAQAADLAHRLIEELQKPITIAQGVSIRVGASIGVAICPRDGLEGDQLVTRADTALYHAKKGGRNAYAVFEPGMDAELRQRQRLEADLALAIERYEFELHFQPRMELAGGEISGYEALIRWRHPEHGLIGPADFIPVAEQSGKIVRIGEWVLAEATRVAAAELGSARVSINVSPVQFRDKQFIETVLAALDSSRLDPTRLEIEITESALIEDDTRASAMLRRLKAEGIRVALDDFGTGYSSLGYLSRFPFDTLKIDRSFVQGIRDDEDALAIVDTIIRLGRALDMTIVAEGVEEADALRLLAGRGCDEIQGFLLGQPQPVDALLREVPAAMAGLLAAVPTREAARLAGAARALRKAPSSRRPVPAVRGQRQTVS